MPGPAVLPPLLPALCRANRAALRHAALLCDALLLQANNHEGKNEHQNSTSLRYQTPSSLPGASGATVGQHLRHALDHVEKAVDAASRADASEATAQHEAVGPCLPGTIRYDARTRGGPEETDVSAALERIRHIDAALQRLEVSASSTLTASSTPTSASWGDLPVQASFCLSGNSDQEHVLPSTVARELGFAAHHAIHHLAMVKLLVLGERWLQPNDLPPDFGRAPATLRHDVTVATTTLQAMGATDCDHVGGSKDVPSQ